MLTVRIAGCALMVSLSSCSGPSKHIRVRAKPRISSARWKTRRAVSDTSKSAFPIPTYCEPCPGNTKATGRAPYGVVIEVCASGDGDLPFDVVPGLADGAKLLGVLVRDLHAVLLFEGHDQLDQIQGVRLQVIGEGGFRGHLLDIDAKLLCDDSAELVEIRFGHPSLLLGGVRARGRAQIWLYNSEPAGR